MGANVWIVNRTLKSTSIPSPVTRHLDECKIEEFQGGEEGEERPKGRGRVFYVEATSGEVTKQRIRALNLKRQTQVRRLHFTYCISLFPINQIHILGGLSFLAHVTALSRRVQHYNSSNAVTWIQFCSYSRGS